MTVRDLDAEPRSPGRTPIAEVISPAPVDEWRKAAASDPRAMADQAPEWTAAGAQAGWRDASRLYRLADGSSVVLPLLHAGGRRPSTTWAASPPAGRGFGGLVGEAAAEPEVVRAVLDDLASQHWLSLRVRPAPETGDLWHREAPSSAQVISRRAHVLDLRPGPDAIRGAMRRSARRAVRRNEQAGLDIQVGLGGELLDTYQALRLASIKHWASVQHEPLWLAHRRAMWRDPPARLHATAVALGDRFRTWVASIDGRPVTANIVVSGPIAHAIRAASDRSSGTPTGVMQYLDWLAIQHACGEGSTALNLGESGTSESLGYYKESLGAVGHDYTEVRIERLPITQVDAGARGLAKRVIGFRD